MTDTPRELPEAIRRLVAAMPEHSYGVNRVTLTLRGGRELRDVYVGWARDVIRVGDSSEIDFDPAEVVDARQQL